MAIDRAPRSPASLTNRAPAWRRLPQALFDLLLPRECALCALALEPGESGSAMCAECARALPGADAPRCPVCGLRSAAGACSACGSADGSIPTLVCCDYAPPADRLVTAFKYGGRLPLGRAIGAAMAARLDAWRREHPLPGDVALLAVPIAPSRLARRGFDQAAVLARRIAACSGLPVVAAGLVRVRDTRPQPGLARDGRRDNLDGAMRGATTLAGRPLVLVDDVITSGATIREAQRAALAAGGRPVLRLAFARTPPPGPA